MQIPTSTRKIVLATGIYPPEEGGPATYSKLLHDRLPAYGFEVLVFPFRLVKHLPKGIKHLVYFYMLCKAALSADMVYAQDTVSVGLPALLAAKITGRKFLIRVPGDYAWEQSVQRYGITDSIDDFQKNTYGFRVEFLRYMQKYVVSHADRAIAPSIYFRDLVRGWVKHTERVITIYNGIDFQEIDQMGHASSRQLHTLITAGRLVPWKGFKELVELMSSLKDWKLAIAGDGPMRKELETYVQQLQLTDRVSLLGSLPRHDLMKHILQSEIFVLNTHFESFSFQIVEVMRLRTPIITTRVGNLTELIEDKHEGMLVDAGDSEQIQAAIEYIHTHIPETDTFVSNAYRKSEQFSIDNTLERTVEIISRLVG